MSLIGEVGPVPMQPQAVGPPCFLIENPERVVRKDEIFETVWQSRIAGDGTLKARNAAVSYKGSPKSTVEIGREMGVAHVLEGSVGRIRINAQLVATESGGSVCAERNDRDFFVAQDDITSALQATLNTAPSKLIVYYIYCIPHP